MRNIVVLSLVAVVLFFSGCASQEEQPPKGYPDFSTPEASSITGFYAAKTKDYSVYLDSLTKEYQQKYGKTRQEQLAVLNERGNTIKNVKDRKRTIDRVEYVDQPEYKAKVYFTETVDGKVALQWWEPLKDIDGEWKLAVISQREAR